MITQALLPPPPPQQQQQQPLQQVQLHVFGQYQTSPFPNRTMSGPIIHAKFDSSNRYLASILVSLDTHQIQVQSVSPSSSSLNASLNLDKLNKVTNISWIDTDDKNTVQLLAVCLSRGSILIYSPQTNDIVEELSTKANVTVLDFHYSSVTRTAWSSDVDGNIHEWDMVLYLLLQLFKVGEIIESVDAVYQILSCIYDKEACLLLGANSIYVYNLKDKEVMKTYPGHIQPISTITMVKGTNLFLTSAKGDRFINLYSLEKVTTKAIFVASASVTSLAIGYSANSDEAKRASILTAINENGNLEVFNDFLAETPSSSSLSSSSSSSSSGSQGHIAKKKRRQAGGVSSRPSNSTIKLSRSEEEIKNPHDANLIINAVSIRDESVLYTWLENATVSYFDTVKWIDETGNNYLLDSNKTIIKRKANLKHLQQSGSYGHDAAASKLYNESHAIVGDGTNIGDLEGEHGVGDNDGGEDEEEQEEESMAEKLERLAMKNQKAGPQRRRKLEDNRNGISLSVILSQSLTNNDHTLLETVLQTTDTQTIKNTISRLNPYLSVVLLDRLSEKIQRQVSRFSQLNYWLKWILVIHGSVIASLPNLNTKLYALHSVLSKKADTLPRLLELRGRLNLLYDGTSLKQSLDEKNEEEEEEVIDSDVEYIEDLDDAEFNGEIEVDEMQDDYVDSEMEMDEEEDVGVEESDGAGAEEDDDDEEEDVASLDGLDNHSDLEID
ncbi:WD40 repeat and Utp12 domain-containing protein [Acetobacter pasteurianus]|nr:WD40 repeat and Utp12 domain-containing protein [Acetobacter pasteurianus]